jgi:hypothetical protein
MLQNGSAFFPPALALMGRDIAYTRRFGVLLGWFQLLIQDLKELSRLKYAEKM